MELRELSQKMHDFVEAKGWYAEESRRPQTMKNIAISLSLEASEVLELFQWQEEVLAKEKLEKELADVTLYLLQLASLAEIDLETAVLQKLAENYGRTWD